MSGSRSPAVLVMAKAPVPGQVKTRLGASVGNDVAAELAAASILDTLDVCEQVFGDCHLALAGDLAAAVRADELQERLTRWTVHPQHGDGFAERLVGAHLDVARAAGAPVVQIGMDTPHLSAADLREVAERIGGADVEAVLGRADDGGWWVLAVTDPGYAGGLGGVEMSTERTYDDTLAALVASGARVAGAATLCDVDTLEDADRAASAAPGTRFAELWTRVTARS